MHISAVYSPLELTYSIEILLTNAKNTAQLLTFRSLVETGKPPLLILESNLSGRVMRGGTSSSSPNEVSRRLFEERACSGRLPERSDMRRLDERVLAQNQAISVFLSGRHRELPPKSQRRALALGLGCADSRRKLRSS